MIYPEYGTQDPRVVADENRQRAAYQAQVELAERQFTYEDALNLANAARLYPTMSPELAVGVAAAAIPWSNPGLRDLVLEDTKAQHGVWSDFRRTIGGGLDLMEALWEEGPARLGRTATRMFQGEGAYDAWSNAGGSRIAMNRAASNLGIQTTPQEGWLRSPFNYGQTPEYGRAVMGAIDAGQPYEQAFQAGRTAAEGAYGLDIYSHQRAKAEETQVHKTIDGVTYASPYSLGRAAAIQVARPDTAPFQVVSSLIDIPTRIGLDPIDYPALAATQWLKGRRYFTPNVVDEVADPVRAGQSSLGAEDLGLHTKGRRPWADGLTADKWLTTGRGQRVIEFLRSEGSIASLHDMLPDLGYSTLGEIAAASRTEDVIGALRPHLGTTLAEAPRLGPRRAVLGAKLPVNDASPKSGWTKLRESKPGTILSRLAAESGGGLTSLNPMDIDESITAAKNFMRTYEAPAESIERVLQHMIQIGPGDITQMRQARSMILEDMLKTLEDAGRSDDFLRKVAEDFDKEQSLFHSYMVNQVGEEVIQRGQKLTKITNPRTGEEVLVPMSKAIFESQTAAQNVFLPSIRDVRRGTSGIRNQTNFLRSKRGKEVLGLEPSKIQRALDMYTGAWRSMTLLRVGWMLRVLPDEIARGLASGYGNVTDGDNLIAMIMTDAGSVALTGDKLQDFIELNKGLGAGLKQINDNPLKGTRFDRAGRDWGVIEWNPDRRAAREGLAAQLSEAHADRMTTIMDDFDGEIDSVIRHLRGDGADTLREYANKFDGDNNWLKTLKGPKRDFWLRQQLEQLEANVTMTAGGRVYMRQYDPKTGQQGPWVDGFGQEVPIYYDWNANQLDEALISEGVDLGQLQSTRLLTNEEKARHLYDVRNEIDLSVVPPTQQFVIADPGSRSIRDLIAKGDVNGEKVLDLEMNSTQYREFVDRAYTYFDEGYSPSPMQRAYTGEARRAKKPEGLTEKAFYILGQAPTNNLVRQPFFKLRYYENMGRLYVHAGTELRKGIRAAARKLDSEIADLNAEKLLDRGVQKHLDQTGSTLPSRVEDLGLSLEDMDGIAKSVALNDTKELFYDLATKSNFADMSKHVMPFADAWWEILSTWGRLLNPYKQGGQAVKNVRRAAVGIDSARRSGWFSEDEFGNEVFNWWPGAGLLGKFPNPAERNLGVTGQASLAQALFVDFGSPRAYLLPGASPMIQVAASAVAPRLPGPLSKFADWFGNGDFPGQDVADVEGVLLSQLPTWLRRFWTALDPSEFQAKWGDEQMAAFEGLVNSGNARYDIGTHDGMRRAIEDSRLLATGLSWGSVFDAFVLPASPRYQVEFMEEITDDPDGEFFLNVSAIGREYNAAVDLLGQDEAIRYMADLFGLDPLNEFQHVGSTREIIPRPVSEASLEFLNANPEAYSVMPLTLMAWTPGAFDDDFNQDAWRKQLAGDPGGRQVRERNTARTLGAIINNRRAYLAYNKINKDHETALAQAAAEHGPSSPEYVAYKAYIDEERRRRVYDLQANYLGFRPGDTVEEVTTKPTAEDFITEIRDLINPSSSAYGYAQQANPELHGFFVNMMDMWEQLEAKSLTEGYGADWWRESTSQTNPMVEFRRQWFTDGLQAHYAALTDEAAKAGAGWISDRLLTFMIEGYSLDEPLILEPNQILPPVPASESAGVNRVELTRP